MSIKTHIVNYKYTLFDDFTDNTRGYIFYELRSIFPSTAGGGKMRAMSIMSASIISNTVE